MRDSIGCYTEQAFKMYGGQLQEITIQFENCLIGAVYDKFGEDTQMRRISDTACEATVAVQISPTFWGWIFQFGKLMWITAPDAMISEFRYKAAMLIQFGSCKVFRKNVLQPLIFFFDGSHCIIDHSTNFSSVCFGCNNAPASIFGNKENTFRNILIHILFETIALFDQLLVFILKPVRNILKENQAKNNGLILRCIEIAS